MEFHPTGVKTIQEELKEESDWTEVDLVRRRALREAIAAGQINFFVRNLDGKPVLSIVLKEGGPRPTFAIVVDSLSDELAAYKNDNILIGIDNLTCLPDPADRLRKIGEALPAFLTRFYTNSWGVSIRIYRNKEDFDTNQLLISVDYDQKQEPTVSVNEAKLG